MIKPEELRVSACGRHQANNQKCLELRNNNAALESPILLLLIVAIVAIIFAVFFGEASKTVESFAQGATILWAVAVLAIIGIAAIIYSWIAK